MTERVREVEQWSFRYRTPDLEPNGKLSLFTKTLTKSLSFVATVPKYYGRVATVGEPTADTPMCLCLCM